LATLNINGAATEVDAAPDTPLLWVIRDTLGYTGTKFGCGQGLCGACTVHLNGIAIRSCQTPLSAVGDAAITTVEGLSRDLSHPVQKAWLAVRLLPVGANDVRGGVARDEREPD
jgi:isoquinoline 1-oxidoreductase subunit alpha